MLKFAILLSAVACTWGGALPEGLLPQLDGRLVGGQDTNIDAFPWQISLQRNGGHYCGGAIYNHFIVLTAAHCVNYVSPSEVKIRAGSTYWDQFGVVIGVTYFIKHEGYNVLTMVNDIAIIRLQYPLRFSANIRAIALAKWAPANGTVATVSGWGTESSGASSISDTLRFAEVNIISQQQCNSSSYYYYSWEIKSGMICAAPTVKDTCQGDSGGPLIVGRELVGVDSWGHGCGHVWYPRVYTDVAALRSWVINNAFDVCSF